jgi:hypothetical protein
MFRDSDETRPKYHETYTNKPSTFQTLQSIPNDNIPGNDMYARDKFATINDHQPQPIPTTYDHYYDPQNPKADWFVDNSYSFLVSS